MADNASFQLGLLRGERSHAAISDALIDLLDRMLCVDPTQVAWLPALFVTVSNLFG